MSDRLHDHLVHAAVGGVGLAMMTNLDIAIKLAGLLVAFIGVGLSAAKELRQWLDRPRKPEGG